MDFTTFFNDEKIKEFWEKYELSRYITLDTMTGRIKQEFTNWVQDKEEDGNCHDGAMDIGGNASVGFNMDLSNVTLFPVAYGQRQFQHGIQIYSIPLWFDCKGWNEEEIERFINEWELIGEKYETVVKTVGDCLMQWFHNDHTFYSFEDRFYFSGGHCWLESSINKDEIFFTLYPMAYEKVQYDYPYKIYRMRVDDMCRLNEINQMNTK